MSELTLEERITVLEQRLEYLQESHLKESAAVGNMSKHVKNRFKLTTGGIIGAIIFSFLLERRIDLFEQEKAAKQANEQAAGVPETNVEAPR